MNQSWNAMTQIIEGVPHEEFDSEVIRGYQVAESFIFLESILFLESQMLILSLFSGYYDQGEEDPNRRQEAYPIRKLERQRRK